MSLSFKGDHRTLAGMTGRTLIVTTHFLPLVGGAQTVYDAIARSAPEAFMVLTSARDHATGKTVPGADAFDASAPYSVERLERVRPDLNRPGAGMLDRIKSFFAGRRINRHLLARIERICREQEIDTICVGASEALMWLPPALKAKGFAPAVTVYTHGEEFSQEAYSPRADSRRAAALAAADGVVAVSSYTAELLQRRYRVPTVKVRCVHNGVDVAAYAEARQVDVAQLTGHRGGKQVMAAGRMVPRKGFDMLVEAWPLVLDRVPDAQLYLAGTGPLLKPLGARITELGLGGSVHQLGYVEEDALVALYQAVDLFTMPNRTMPDGDTEGFGLVFLEAAAAGTPSVGGRAGGAVDAIVDGETGLLVDGTDPGAIADAVEGLLLDDDRRGRMAEAAYAHACQNDWSGKARELLDFFDELRARVR